MINMQSSKGDLAHLKLSHIESESNLLEFYTCDSVTFDNLRIENSTVAGDHFIKIEKSSAISITDFMISGATKTVLYITRSQMERMQNLIITDSIKAMIVTKQSTVEEITNSVFSNNGKSGKGGAIQISDSRVNVIHTIFLENEADIGGAIYFSCTSMNFCNMSLADVNFTANVASESGGAIHYTYNRPIIEKVMYSSNYAKYGPDIASYPVKIILNNIGSDKMLISQLGSGIAHTEILKFSLKDYDDQIMVLNNIDQIRINPTQPDLSSIKGVNSRILVKGIATFDEFTAVAEPGSSNIQFKVSSKAINDVKVNAVYGNNIPNSILTINFRYCQPGEYMLNNTCFECSPGSYSLLWNSTSCHKCPDNAVCLGKDQISVASGYWRRTPNSTEIIKCINQEACKGGYEPSNEHPVICEAGYTGNLCSQ